jgi:hypothetical protein
MARLSGTNVVLTTTATGRQVGAGSSCFDEHLLAAGLRYTGGGFTGCCAALLASRACQFRRLPKGGELSADLTDLRRGNNNIMLNRIPRDHLGKYLHRSTSSQLCSTQSALAGFTLVYATWEPVQFPPADPGTDE